jgi:hypothetical protein
MWRNRLALLVSKTGEYVSVIRGSVMKAMASEEMAVTYSIHLHPSGLCTIIEPI